MVKTSVIIADGRVSFKDLEKQAANDEGYVDIGILENSTYVDEHDRPVAEIAFYQEFGTQNIPERSFLRSTNDAKKNEWLAEYTQVLKQNPDDLHATRKALDAVGLRAVLDMRAAINANIEPALNKKTVKAKARRGLAAPDLALVDTGTLSRAIDFATTEGKDDGN